MFLNKALLLVKTIFQTHELNTQFLNCYQTSFHFLLFLEVILTVIVRHTNSLRSYVFNQL